jgi:hypothetical protein
MKIYPYIRTWKWSWRHLAKIAIDELMPPIETGDSPYYLNNPEPYLDGYKWKVGEIKYDY